MDDPELLLAEDIDDEDECVECGETGTLVLCDNCDAGMHHICAGIDMANEPDEWFCPVCRRLRSGDGDDGGGSTSGASAGVDVSSSQWQDDVYKAASQTSGEWYAPTKKAKT